jgi:hypothetical protein
MTRRNSMKARADHCDPVCVVVFAVVLALFPAAVQAQSVLTWHNDNSRTGQNLQETILTLKNVNTTQFGKKFTLSVDGQIFAQPLYVSGVSIPGKGTRNVVYVATENDSVYAFAANGSPTTPLWQRSFTSPAEGITAAPCVDVGVSGSATPTCKVITPVVGITATPVIDPTSNTLYVVALTKESGSYVDRLHALDITTGDEKFGGPVVIEASVHGTGAGSVGGIIAFNPSFELPRSALLLLNGVVYLSSAAFGGDQGPYHGWVLGYAARTLAQVGVFNTSPNIREAGIWGSGAGPTAAPGGSAVFVLTGNGKFDANTGGLDYGDSFLKLSTAGGLSVADYFTPVDQAKLAQQDLDLSAGGGMIPPMQASGKYLEIIGGGKEGILYVVNRVNMGKFNPTANSCIQTVVGSKIQCPGGTGTPAYFNNAVYFSGCGDFLKRFSLINGLLSTSPVSQSPEIYAEGNTPSISANGSTSGIVWAISSLPTGGVLHAYDASDVSKELYKSNQNQTRDSLPPSHFAVPMIANGRVYVGTFDGLVVYGLL